MFRPPPPPPTDQLPENEITTSDTRKTWLEQPLPRDMGARMAGHWREGRFLSIAGAYDPIGGLLAQKAGFQALYLSGAALTASLGLPDLGLITMDELVSRARAIVRVIRAPLLANLTEFEQMGYAMAIWPVSSLRIATKATESFYGELHAKGSAAGKLDAMQSRAELYELIGYFQYEALDASIQRTVLDDMQ